MDRKMPPLTTDCQIAGLSRRQQLVPERFPVPESFPVSERFPKETKVTERFPKEKEAKVSERPKEAKPGWLSSLPSAHPPQPWREDVLHAAEDVLCVALGAGTKHRQPWSASTRHRPSDPPQVTLRLVETIDFFLPRKPPGQGEGAKPPRSAGGTWFGIALKPAGGGTSAPRRAAALTPAGQGRPST